MTMSTVGVLQSPGKLTLSPPTVRRVQLGSSFLGQKLTQTCPYVSSLSLGKYDSIGAFADSGNDLSQAAKFSGIRFAPKFLVLWVDKKVPHLYKFTGAHVKDCIEFFDGEQMTCCIRWCEAVGVDLVVCVHALFDVGLD